VRSARIVMFKILVIEDEEDFRSFIGEMLRAENCSVIEAEDGEIGVQKAKEEIPDLIVCNIRMPKLDGYEVFYQLRNHSFTQTIPFIFLSGKGARENRHLGMSLDADDYLMKPFTRQALLSAIATQLAKRKVSESKL
jgi:two-component system, sensor histidine kinase and response regulator